MSPGSMRKLQILTTVPEEPASLLDIEPAVNMSPAIEKFTIFDPALFAKSSYSRPSSFIRVALYASLAWNVVLALALVGYYYREPPQHHHGISRYAKITRHRSAWNFGTLYGSRGLDDEQRADQMWEAHNASGVVALHNRRAHRWHLPQSQAFPLDTDFSLYTISGIHSMNCLQKLRQSVVRSHRREKQTESYADLLQCADVLRQEVMCHASDTPMYKSRIDADLEAGEGQTRMCRDWSQLERWYEENSACYSGDNAAVDQVDQYKNCPAMSRFAPAVREYFGELAAE